MQLSSGKTFDEISWAKFCASCGEKTAVCPHKITKSDLLVVLPAGCTHIKLARPTVRVSLPSLQAQRYYQCLILKIFSKRFEKCLSDFMRDFKVLWRTGQPSTMFRTARCDCAAL